MTDRGARSVLARRAHAQRDKAVTNLRQGNMTGAPVGTKKAEAPQGKYDYRGSGAVPLSPYSLAHHDMRPRVGGTEGSRKRR